MKKRKKTRKLSKKLDYCTLKRRKKKRKRKEEKAHERYLCEERLAEEEELIKASLLAKVIKEENRKIEEAERERIRIIYSSFREAWIAERYEKEQMVLFAWPEGI